MCGVALASDSVEVSSVSFVTPVLDNSTGSIHPNKISSLDVTVMFVDAAVNVFENETSVTVQLMTSNDIKRNFFVRVRGGLYRISIVYDI